MARIFIGSLLMLAVLALTGVAWFFHAWDRATLHYKLTYEVDVGGSIRSGSGVIEVTREDTTKLPLPNTGYGYSIRGEAPVVDLGNGRYLFSLLTEKAPYLPYNVFSDLARPDETPVETTRKLMAQKPQAELTGKQIPLLVTFADIADPKTVRKVDPDDLAASFGPGIALKRVTLAITDEPITEGRTESVLPWLAAVGRKRATLIPNPPRLRKDAHDPEIQYLTPGSFSTELYK